MQISIQKSVVALSVSMLMLGGFAGYVYAAGQSVTLCASKIGFVYAAGTGFLKKKCDKNDTALSLGGSANVFNQTLQTDKTVYGPTDNIRVVCSATNNSVYVYVSDSPANLYMTFPCGYPAVVDPSQLTAMDLPAARTLYVIEATPYANCDSLGYDQCKQVVDSQGNSGFVDEISFRVE